MPQNVVIECAARGTYQFYIHTDVVIAKVISEGAYVNPDAWKMFGTRLDFELVGRAIIAGVTGILGVMQVMTSRKSLCITTHSHADNEAILIEALKVIQQETQQDLLVFLKSRGQDNRRKIGVFSGTKINLPLAEFTLEPQPWSQPRSYKKPPSKPLFW